MSISKRLSAIFIILALIVTSMVPAFAAPLSDIAGKDYEDAVNKLSAYNIVAGMDDGTFQGETNLTRAQFATFIVKMYGLGEQSHVDTRFPDVDQNHWASGYVNVVADRGVIVGADDGNFYPDKNVTYGEAITVLMKMLGYAPIVDNRGVWPMNYISKASSIDLTDGVAVSSFGAATRGNLAKLMWNTLTTNPLVESGNYDVNGNPEYKVANDADNKKLLYTNFNESFEAEKVVTEVPLTAATADSNKIKFDTLSDRFAVPADVDANSLLGKKVKFVADKDENIKWLKVTTNSEDMINDVVKEISSKTDTEGNILVDRIKFKTLDKTFYAADDMKLIYNGVQVTANDANLSALLSVIAETSYLNGKQDDAFISAVLDKDTKKIKVANITQDIKKDALKAANGGNDWKADESTVASISAGIVSEITTDPKAKGKGLEDIDIKALKADISLKISKVFVYKDGKVANLDDIKVGDYVRYSKFGAVKYIDITTPTIVTAEIDSFEDVSSMQNAVVVAGENRYKFSQVAYYSDNAGTDKWLLVDTVTDATAQKEIITIATFQGVEGTKLFLNKAGKIVYMENNVADSSFMYGFVKESDSATNAKGEAISKLTIVKTDGTVVTYNTTDFMAAGVVGELVAYKLNRSNEITKIYSKNSSASDLAAAKVYIATVADTDFTTADRKVDVGSTDALIASSTAFLNFRTNLAGDYNVTTETWETVKDAIDASGSFANSIDVIYDRGVVKVALMNEAAFTTGSRYGVVVGTGIKDGEKTIKINNKGVVTEYKYSDSVNDGVIYQVKGLLVEYSLSNNKVDIVGVADAVYDNTTVGYNYVNGRLGYNRTITSDIKAGKIVSVDTENKVVSFLPITDHKGTTGAADTEIAVALADNVAIYNVTDVTNVTYTGDVATLTNGQYFVYDVSENILVIVKKDDTAAKSQIAELQ